MNVPLPTCDAGHDYSEPYVERLRGASGVTIVRRVKSCLGCNRTVEVFEPYERVAASRIKSYPLDSFPFTYDATDLAEPQ